ncbi:uncharacterized protein MONBRDRAFT_29853 [Monosiga brevicollis MX1]|uniref:Cytochrome b561 domain-containing protein n=1 Tax=Monosiga brevicollis TaxID=81824 RepID=A9VCB3_MONBE|nr:uncharacterized protein MONBRDRAFT_29853 [Monosiga brevicollis MX1]EDQ84830.1 predicted protein [Monosiga brevicollis MX1]|eukprot:XP_001750331.1 hypothetical protein [Monosiga brevicollis MX1]
MVSQHEIDANSVGVGLSLTATVAVIVADVLLLGFGKARHESNGFLMRILYITYFILLAAMLRWDGALNQLCYPSGECVLAFNYHPLLLSVAWLFCIAESLSAYKTAPLVFAPRDLRKRYHAFMNLIALALGWVGAAVAFKNHAAGKKPHLASIHSWLGLATLMLLTFQFIYGAFVYFMSSNVNLKRSFLLTHKYLGAAAYVSACGVISLGISTYILNHSVYAENYTHRRRTALAAVVVVWAQAFHVIAGLVSSTIVVEVPKLDTNAEEEEARLINATEHPESLSE